MKSLFKLMTVMLLFLLVLAGCSEEEITDPDEEAEAAEVVTKEDSAKESEESPEDTETKEQAAKEQAEKDAAEAEAAAQKAEEEAKAKAEAEAKAAEKAKAEEAAKQKEQEEQVLVDHYVDFSIAFSDDLSVVMTDLSDLFSRGDFYSEDWIFNLALTLTQMDLLLQTVRDYEHEIPSSYSRVHELLLLAVDEFQHLPDDMPTAIDNMDVEGIERSTLYLESGTDYINQATAEIESINQ